MSASAAIAIRYATNSFSDRSSDSFLGDSLGFLVGSSGLWVLGLRPIAMIERWWRYLWASFRVLWICSLAFEGFFGIFLGFLVASWGLWVLDYNYWKMVGIFANWFRFRGSFFEFFGFVDSRPNCWRIFSGFLSVFFAALSDSDCSSLKLSLKPLLWWLFRSLPDFLGRWKMAIELFCFFFIKNWWWFFVIFWDSLSDSLRWFTISKRFSLVVWNSSNETISMTITAINNPRARYSIVNQIGNTVRLLLN